MDYRNDGQHRFNPTRALVKTAEGSMIRGLINIGVHERLSDFLNDPDAPEFLIVFDAMHQGKKGEVYFINRRHVTWVKPDEEELGTGR